MDYVVLGAALVGCGGTKGAGEDTFNPADFADADTDADADSDADSDADTDADTDTDGETGSATDETGASPLSFPLTVDEVWVPSGYMGDGEAGGVVDLGTCLSPRPGEGRGDCHAFQHTVGAAGWAGVYWLYPSGNWGTVPGFEVPPGATGVRFQAWTDAAGAGVAADFFAGGVVGTFSDSLNVRRTVPLTTAPQEISLDFAGVEPGVTIGGFGWSWSPGQDAVLYVDDIVWESVPETTEPPATYPLVVDAVWAPSGFMGDGETGGLVDLETCAPARPGEGRGGCHAFRHTPGAAGWAGVYWQYPEGNWGMTPGYPTPPGATGVRFYAWTDGPALQADFFAGGIVGAFSDTLNARTSLALTGEPQAFYLDFGGQDPGEVIGGFGWSWAPGAPATLYLDDVVWVAEGDSTTPVDTGGGTDTGGEEAIALPFALDSVFAPSGFMGDGAAGGLTDTSACASPRPGGAEGNCHAFEHRVGAAGWAGVYWQYPEGNWGAFPGAEVPPGARRVRWYAWASRPGLRAQFFAGGIGGGAYVDSFNVNSGELSLSTVPTAYSLDLTGVSYPAGVLGGFGWSWAPGADATIYLDDIVWE